MTKTHRILQMLGDRSIFDIAHDAGCTHHQLAVLQLAAEGMTDAEIATARKVTRIAISKSRNAACRKIMTYLETEVVSV